MFVCLVCVFYFQGASPNFRDASNSTFHIQPCLHIVKIQLRLGEHVYNVPRYVGREISEHVLWEEKSLSMYFVVL